MVITNQYKNTINKIINIMFIILGFSIFIDWKISRALLIVILVLTIIDGDIKENISKIFKDKIILGFILFIGIFIIGLLWTDNFYAGRKITERPMLYLLSTMMFISYKPKYLKYFLWAMLSSLLFTALYTFLIKVGIVEHIYNGDHAPFMNRNYVAGMLVFGFSFALYKIDFLNLKKTSNIFWIFYIISMVYALVTCGSRTGLINFFIATFIVLIYKLKLSYKKIFFILLSLSLFAITLYNTSSIVKSRVNRTVYVIKNMDMKAQIFNHETNRRTSLTCRFEFWYYAWELGKQNPLLGIGTGDGIDELSKLIGKKEVEKLFKKCAGNGSGQFNPHNMYLFMFMQFGIIGVIILLWILYIQLKVSFASKNAVFISLIITTMVALLSSSELFTTRYFILFYAYSVTLMYIFYLEEKKGNKLI